MKDQIFDFLRLSNEIKEDASKFLQGQNGKYLISVNDQIIPFPLVKGTRGYLEIIVNQINRCYINNCFDAAAIMIRKLFEILIIEVFEHFHIEKEIKDNNGDFLFFDDLISKLQSETHWNLGRNTKKALPKIKSLGDKAAHNRRFIAIKNDIDTRSEEIREALQELLILASN